MIIGLKMCIRRTFFTRWQPIFTQLTKVVEITQCAGISLLISHDKKSPLECFDCVTLVKILQEIIIIITVCVDFNFQAKWKYQFPFENMRNIEFNPVISDGPINYKDWYQKDCLYKEWYQFRHKNKDLKELTLSPWFYWSEWEDSNLRPLAPHTIKRWIALEWVGECWIVILLIYLNLIENCGSITSNKF